MFFPAIGNIGVNSLRSRDTVWGVWFPVNFNLQ